MERIGQGPIGTFAPGSELARERKGQVPFFSMARSAQLCTPYVCARHTTDQLKLSSASSDENFVQAEYYQWHLPLNQLSVTSLVTNSYCDSAHVDNMPALRQTNKPLTDKTIAKVLSTES